MPGHVVVVGAGVVGAAVAYHLAKRKIKTTVLEQHDPAHGVTANSFAWINAVNGIDDDLTALRVQAIEEFDRLESETGGRIRPQRGGALIWRDNDIETEALAAHCHQVNYPVELYPRFRIEKLEPNLVSPPSLAVFAEKEAAIDPILLTRQFLALAGVDGTRVLTDHPVTDIVIKNNVALGVVTSRGKIDADSVVIASGVGTTSLLAQAGVHLPINSSPSILIRYASRHRHINKILSCPEFEIRQPAPTRILGAENHVADTGENGPLAIADRALTSIRSRIRGSDDISIAGVEVGLRPIPNDGKPLLGYLSSVENIYVATMHAAITLSALAGRLCAEEIALGDRPPELRQFHPDRFTSSS